MSFPPGSAARRAAWGFLALWTSLNVLSARRFPTVLIDEPENANHAVNLAAAGRSVFTLYDDLYPRQLYYLRQAWPPVIRPFFVHPLSWFIHATGFGLGRARLFSLLTGVLCLWLVFDIGRRLRDESLGLAAMALLGLHFSFLYAAHVIRPEALLTLDGLACFWLLLRGDNGSPWWTLAAGLAAGLAPGIHTNGLAVIAALMLTLLVRADRRRLPAAILGTAVGFGWFLLSADWSLFRPGVDVLFFKEFASPPILKRTWDVFTPLVQETDRYFGSWEFLNWKGGAAYTVVFGWQSFLSIVSLARACRRPGALGRAGRFGLWIMAAFAYLVSQKAANYLSLIAPFAALALADWVTAPETPRRLNDFLSGAAAFLIVFPLGSFPPAAAAALFALLPRDAFQKVMLAVLLCAFFNVSTVRAWVDGIPASFAAFWPASLAGLALAAGLRAVRRWTAPALPSFIEGTAAGAALATVLFAASITAARPTFESLCRDLSRDIPAGARVAGPQIFWLGFPSSVEYRDIGALTWHHLLLNSRDIAAPLSAWKAGYVILDPPMIRQLRRFTPPGAPVFPWPYHLVRRIDGGPVYGQLFLVKMDWS